MSAPLIARMSAADLNQLLGLLEVHVSSLSECIVGRGFTLDMAGNPAPGIHYLVDGHGKVSLRGAPPVDVAPHTLIIVPPNCPFQLQAPACQADGRAPVIVDGRLQYRADDLVHRFVAGDEDSRILMICGFFNARVGSAAALFEDLQAPIIEQFSARDHLDDKLRAALTELMNQEIGAGAMSAALLKQVIVTLLRRSLGSVDCWVSRFALLSDPQVARAFAGMTADPGGPHSVESLAQTACLSRSAFMARFAAVVGQSPMHVLRDLRMRQAAEQLLTGAHSIEQVVRNAGYASRSSFVRAFRDVYGTDPSGYRASRMTMAPRVT